MRIVLIISVDALRAYVSVIVVILLFSSLPSVSYSIQLWSYKVGVDSGGWKYRKSFVIQSESEAQTNYQVKIKVHATSGTDNHGNMYAGNNCRPDFGDIRFTKADGVTQLDYWFESISDDTATFWIEIDNIPVNPDKAEIYIYYQNPNVITTSNGPNTFLYFFDFEGSLDGWEILQSGDDGGVAYSSEESFSLQYSARSQQPNVGHPSQHSVYSPAVTMPSPQFRVFWAFNIKNKMNSGGVNHFDLILSKEKYPIAIDRQMAFTINPVYGSTQVYSYNGAELVYLEPTVFGEWRTFLVKGDFETDQIQVTIDGENTYGPFDFLVPGEQSDFPYLGVFNDNYDGFIDAVWVAKWIDVEPSHGSWGTEEMGGTCWRWLDKS